MSSIDSIDWPTTAISMVDRVFQPEIVERVNKLLTFKYKINYQTWPFQSKISATFPLPSLRVWEGDFGGPELIEEYGLKPSLKVLDEAIRFFEKTSLSKMCKCSAQDLLWFGCRC